MSETDPIRTPESNGRDLRIRHVIRDCIRRRAKGENVSDQFVLEAHPDLMPQLAARLRNLHVIESAQRQIDAEPASNHALQIRCPDCHVSMELKDESRLSDVVCSSCGAAFDFINDASMARPQEIQQIGQFQVLEKLGIGAFGTVWRARDTELDRLVAVKVPRRGQLDSEETEKFIREARTAAQLTHANIVRVYEVGREDDRLYIVTDLIEGRDLADWLDIQRPTPREAAQLCVTIAEALHHAHERGVIHRDLKPSNIMIDSGGNPHLMDFGLAKREVGEVTMTADGTLLGTPAYMSPEQARGTAHDADRRSDIYSVGVILYELLTGERPFRGTTRMLLHQILIEDAPSPRKLNSAVPRDLETICLKCLEKDSKRRYQTANALADDLRRFLNGQSVRARPITRLGREWRWCKRNPLPASSLAGLFLAIVVGFVGITSFWIQATAARELAERSRYFSDIGLAQQAWDASNVDRCRELLSRYIAQGDQPDLRSFEWHYLSRLCEANEPDRILGQPKGLGVAVHSPDGEVLAVSTRGTLSLWNLADGREVARVQAHGTAIHGIAFDAHGNTLATCGMDGIVKLWRLQLDENPSIVVEHVLDYRDKMPSGSRSMSVALSPDGQTLASSVYSNIFLWDVTQRRDSGQLAGHQGEVWSVRFSPDGSRLVSAGEGDGAVRLWDVTDGEPIGAPMTHGNGAWTAVFSPDGATIASGGVDSTIKLWEVATGQEKVELAGHTKFVHALAFHPDGKTLASGAWDRTVRLWSLETLEKPPLILRGFSGFVSSVEYSPDGSTLTATDITGEVKLYDVPLAAELSTLPGHDVAFSENGTSLLSCTWDGTCRLWDPTTCSQKLGFEVPPELGDYKSFSADFSTVATITSQAAVELWDLGTRDKRSLAGRQLRPAERLLLSPDGKSLAISSGSRVQVWDMSTGTVSPELDVYRAPNGGVLMTFSPDSARFATAYEEKPLETFSVRLWDLTGELILAFKEHDTPIKKVAFSSDGRVLASASWVDVKIWDVPTGTLKQTLKGYPDIVNCLAFTPDGKRLATAGLDGTVKLWDVSTGDELITLHGHQGPVLSVTFSPSGGTLASADSGGTVRLWRGKQ